MMNLEKIDYNKLLNREPIQINLSHAAEPFTKDKIILVTGGCGSIGSEIVRQLTLLNPKQIIVFDNAESPMFYLQQEFEYCNDVDIQFIIGDVRDEHRVIEVFKKYKPDIVYHAAAYKHVPMMELNVTEAVKTNVIGTFNVASVASDYDVSTFVLISTDKAVNPTNVMGATKRVCELYVQYLNTFTKTKYIITRFGNVLGSRGSVVPIFLNQIKVGGPVQVTHKDVERFFMTISEACQLVLQASALGDHGEIFLFDMGKPIKIYELAKSLIREFGDDSIKIKFIGLRPGEKLYEELSYESEVKEFVEKRIMKLESGEVNFNIVVPYTTGLLSYKYLNDTVCKSYLKNILKEEYSAQDL